MFMCCMHNTHTHTHTHHTHTAVDEVMMRVHKRGFIDGNNKHYTPVMVRSLLWPYVIVVAAVSAATAAVAAHLCA